MSFLRLFKGCASTVVFAAALTACGGGGGSPGVPLADAGTGTGGTGGNCTSATGATIDCPVTPAAPVAADLIVTLDKAAISNSGSDQATLSVLAVDGSRNVVVSVPVAVSVDSNAVFTPASGAVTGANGSFSGTIGIGADKSNRLIRYVVTSGSLSKTGAISVGGIGISAASVPSVPSPNASVTLTVKVKDAAGGAVPNTQVSARGIPGTAISTAQTSANGDAVFTFTAPSADGTYPISIDAAGVQSSYDLRVFTPGSGALPPVPASATISGVSALATPVVVSANTAGSTTNQSEVRVLFIDDKNTPIPNMRVRFFIASNGLPGESLSTGNGLVYSDTTGVAKTSYIAATTGSPNNGVVIVACYDKSDFLAGSATDAACVTKKVQTALTVTANPVNLTIGTDNKIQKTASGISYIKKFEIQAVNAAGNYAPDVPLSAVVDIVEYRKSPTSTVAAVPSPVFKWCPNEDRNRNGVLDTLPANEDVNLNGKLEPRQSDVAIGFSGSNKTDATGLALLQLQYPQNVATWLHVRVTVTAGVSGSEGAATYEYYLDPAQEDVSNGSFLSPPYGSQPSCTDPN